MRRLIRSRAAAALALLAVLALALSACDGGDSSTAAATPGQPDSEAMTAFQSCMEDNGASLPDPGSAGAPPTGAPPATSDDSGSAAQPPQMPELDADTQAALDACSDLMPAPPSGAPTGAPPSTDS